MKYNDIKRRVSILILFAFIFSLITVPPSKVKAAAVEPLKIEAESYNATGGNLSKNDAGVRPTSTGTGIGSINKGDWVRYDNVDLTAGYNTLSMNLCLPSVSASVEIWLDCEEINLDPATPTYTRLSGGSKVGTLSGMTPDSGWGVYSVRTIDLSIRDAGVYDVYVVFKGPDFGVGNADWFEFSYPTKRVEAESFSAKSGVNNAGKNIGSCDNNDWVRYDNIDLTGYNRMMFNASVNDSSGKVEIYIDCQENGSAISGGTLIGTLANLQKDSPVWTSYTQRSATLSRVNGIHNVYLKFVGSSYGILNLDWVELYKDTLVKSNVAELKSISIDKGTISPSFNKDRTNYTALVNADVSSITLTATAQEVGYAITKINGVIYDSSQPKVIEINKGVTTLSLEVTAEDGIAKKTYTLTIMRKLSNLLKNVYVSPSGSDDNNGTAEAPMKTIAYAAINAEPNNGAVVHLSEGLFVETVPAVLPPGVSLIGAGTDKTIIKSKITHTLGVTGTKVNMSNYGDYYFTVQARNSENAEISHIKFDGKLEGADTNAHAAVYVSDSTNFKVHDIEVIEFDYMGVWARKIVNSHIYNSKFYNSGRPDPNSCVGNINIGEAVDSSIHDNLIRENRGGYGIKGVIKDKEPGMYLDLVRLKIYNNDIDLRQVGGWGQGQPNMSIELWTVNPTDCEIYNNKIKNCVSLPGTLASGQTNSFRIHHNQFLADRDLGNGYTYALEVSISGMEIDHNYFEHGYYPIASFGPLESRHNIHDNVFFASEGVDMFHYQSGLVDSNIENNIIYITDTVRARDKGKLPIVSFSSGVGRNLKIANNIFYASDVFNNREMFNLTNGAALGNNVSVTNNVFYNWKNSGDNPLIGDPKISTNDFRLSYDSEAYKYGFKEIDTSTMGLTKDFYFGDQSDELKTVWLNRKGDTEGASIIRAGSGEIIDLEVTGRTVGGYLTDLTNAVKTYSVSDVKGANSAIINDNGRVVALNPGVCKITVTVQSGGVKKSSDVYIAVDDEVNAYELRINKSSVIPGDSAQINSYIKYKYGNYEELNETSYVSTLTRIADVNDAGIITAHSIGETKIYGSDTINGKVYNGNIDFKVVDNVISDISVATDREILYPQEETLVKVIGTMSDGQAADLSRASVKYSVTTPEPFEIVQNPQNPLVAKIKAKSEVGTGVIIAEITMDGKKTIETQEVRVILDTENRVTAPWELNLYGSDSGSVNYKDGSINISTNGDKIWGSADNFAYAYQDVVLPEYNSPKRIEVSAKINSIEKVHSDSSTGVMIRDNNNKDSKHVMLRVKADGTLLMIKRSKDADSTQYQAFNEKITTFPAEIKLVKEGDYFYGYYKKDGKWSKLTVNSGDYTGETVVAMDNLILAGVAAYSGTSSSYIIAKFDDVSVRTLDVPITGITASATQQTLAQAGDTTSIQVLGRAGQIIIPSDYLEDAVFTYSSANENVAVVDSEGVITAKGKGFTDINVTAKLKDGKLYRAVTNIGVGDSYGQLPNKDWSATASHYSSKASAALDGLINTRWDTGQSQAPGQYYVLDMKELRSINTIEIDASTSNDWTRSYNLYVSEDGVNWGAPIKSGTGKKGVTTITFDTVTTRFIKIENTTVNVTNWWSLYEVRVYNYINANLSELSLKLDGSELIQKFDKDNLFYVVDVPEGTANVTLNAAALDSSASQIKVNGEVQESGADTVVDLNTTNMLNIEATGNDGSIRVYRVTVKDFAALKAAVTEANVLNSSTVEGYKDGNYSPEAKTALGNAIMIAENEMNRFDASDDDILKAVDELKAAMNAYENSKIVINKAALIEAIAQANTLHDAAVEGSSDSLTDGQYPSGAKAEFKKVIDEAQAAADNSEATKAEVDKALENLKAASEAFEAKKLVVDRTILEAAIASAKNMYLSAVEGIYDGQYNYGSKEAFKAAIDNAEQIFVKVEVNQVEVDDVVKALEAAKLVFEGERVIVERETLNTLIEESEALYSKAVEGTKQGHYKNGAKKKFLEAIEQAKSIFAKAEVTQTYIDKASTDLEQEKEKFTASVITKLEEKKLEVVQAVEEAASESGAAVVSAEGVDYEILTLAEGKGVMLLTDLGEVVIGLPEGFLDKGKVTLNAGTLKVAKAEQENPKEMSTHKVIGKVYDFTMQLVDGESVEDLGKKFAAGKKVLITVKLAKEDLKDVQDYSRLKAHYYNPEKEEWEEVGGSFDAEKMTFSFSVEHFSTYAILYSQQQPVVGTIPQTGYPMDFTVLMLLGMFALLFGGVMLYSRRKTEKV